MRFAHRVLVLSFGLFSIAAQTLLFRQFITTFEGNDIGIGVFFASWLLWVGLGALLSSKWPALSRKLSEKTELVFLLYVPAFLFQLVLILNAREIAGIESYALFSIKMLLPLSAVVNAPVSFLTGLLFPVICGWISNSRQSGNGGGETKFVVAHVYILEALGSFVGGLGTTILLAMGYGAGRIFFLLALVVTFATFCVQSAERKKWAMGLIPLCVIACIFGGVDKRLTGYIQTMRWTQLFGNTTPDGAMQTPQGLYLYGRYREQWVTLCQGAVYDAMPDDGSAARIAAISMCQNPNAKNVLVIGSGLGLCGKILQLPQVQQVTWMHFDSVYAQRINSIAPAEFRITDERFNRPGGDIRWHLSKKPDYYDMVIVNLPEPTNSVLNRYYTLEFYQQVQSALKGDGVLAVNIPGGENIMGTELVNLGASTKHTLEQVFSRLVLTAGEETWFLVSDSEQLTGDPGVLQDRFAGINGAAGIFPPSGLLSVYLPDRAAKALDDYGSANLPEKLLVNSDERPLANLYSLLLAARQSGAAATRFLKAVGLTGIWFFIIPVAVLLVTRLVYILNSGGGGRDSGFDSLSLVFSAGWVGIGVLVVLLYMYQTKMGSLYLYIGVISSLFMIGLTVGAAVARKLLAKNVLSATILLPAALSINIAILLFIEYWSLEQWTHAVFAIVFVLCGFCSGMYFPLAAGQMARCGLDAGKIGAKLETADHFGAAVGGFLTSLVIIPALGSKAGLLIFAALLAAHFIIHVMSLYKHRAGYKAQGLEASLRRAGYVLFAVVTAVILCSNLTAAAIARFSPAVPIHKLQALAGQNTLEQAQGTLAETGRDIRYFKTADDEDKVNGYIFTSAELAEKIRGFGGKINLAVYVDTAGNLLGFNIISSNETPSYLVMLNDWMDTLAGHNLFEAGSFSGVDSVSGATVSSDAVLSALEVAGKNFAGQILGYKAQALPVKKTGVEKYLPDTAGAFLLGAFVITLIATWRAGFWVRLVVLALNLLIGGFLLNTQYSSGQATALLSLRFPQAALQGPFLLMVAVPLFVLLFGNLYCGYICPYGAAQELACLVTAEKFKSQPANKIVRKAAFTRYIVLAILLATFFISREQATISNDPLIRTFSINAGKILLVTAGLTMLGSVFYIRFWCRYLCPAGAFLSLVGRVAILGRFMPRKKFDRCEFGFAASAGQGCLCCDRCRYQSDEAVAPRKGDSAGGRALTGVNKALPVLVIIAAVFICGASLDKFMDAIPASADAETFIHPSAGEVRDVDIEKIKEMIRQNQLSDEEALFYEKTRPKE